MPWRRWFVVALHVVAVPVSLALAFVLRFDGPVPEQYRPVLLATAPVLLAFRLACFAGWKLFSGWWRHVGMVDLVSLFKATTLSSALFAGYLVVFGYIPGYPRSVILLEWGIAMLVFGGMRFLVRYARERARAPTGRGGKRTLVVGAGDAGAHLVKTILQDPSADMWPVGLVDDDPTKASLQVHGVPVLGTTLDLERLVEERGVDLLVLAVPSATREQRRRLAERCGGLDVELKIVPDLRDLIDGKAGLLELRRVVPQDLLGRPQISLDLERLHAELGDRVVLVSGGAGSIGSELARQVAALAPDRLILLDQAESGLYLIELELRRAFPGIDLVPVVADVTDSDRIERVFAFHRPDFVFHAAAYKHVPMMEANVTEAIRNNVFGTVRVADCAARYGARHFVLISTDKAVRPSSVMGASKRVAERLVLELPHLTRRNTDFRAVRFGNVLDSAGSVVPLFRAQIARGGPVTVTHRDMTRYFMTIPEAVQLVLQASVLPDAAGRVSMLEMGAPVRILQMAETLIRLSGLEPYDDVPIVFTGMRPGEKLHEDLMSGLEETVPTNVERVRVVHSDGSGTGDVEAGLERLGSGLRERDDDGLILALAALVPEAVGSLEARYAAARARKAIRPGGLRALDGGAREDRRRTDPPPSPGASARTLPR